MPTKRPAGERGISRFIDDGVTPTFDEADDADLPAKKSHDDLPARTGEIHLLASRIKEKLEVYKKEIHSLGKGHHSDRAAAVINACNHATSVGDFTAIIQSQLNLFSDDEKQNVQFSNKQIPSAFKKNSMFSFFGVPPTDYLTKSLDNNDKQEGWYQALKDAMKLINDKHKPTIPAADLSSSSPAAPKR